MDLPCRVSVTECMNQKKKFSGASSASYPNAYLSLKHIQSSGLDTS